MKRILMVFVSIIFIMFLVSCNEEEKVEQINIKFVIEENIYDIKKEVNYIVSIADIPNITEEDIEGIYYDSGYSSKYNNEQIKEDTILYIRRVKENIEVTFIVGDIEEVVTLKSNSVVTLDNIPNINAEDIIGLYYDKEYTNEYNNELIKENIILYVKTEEVKENIDVIIMFDDEYYILHYEEDEVVEYEDILLGGYWEIQGLYYDSDFTNEYNNEKVYHNLMLYVDAKEMIDIIFIIDDEEYIVPIERYTKIIDEYVPVDDEYLVVELYYDSGYSKRYINQVLNSDTTIYVKTTKETLVEGGETFSGPLLSTEIYSTFNLVDDGCGVIISSIEEFNVYKNEKNINEEEKRDNIGTITLSSYLEELFSQNKSIIMIPCYSEHDYPLEFINLTREGNTLYVNVKTQEVYFITPNVVVPTTRFYIYVCDQSEIGGIDRVLLRDIRIDFNYKIIKVDMGIKDANENINVKEKEKYRR